jgi:hypothetical protein
MALGRDRHGTPRRGNRSSSMENAMRHDTSTNGGRGPDDPVPAPKEPPRKPYPVDEPPMPEEQPNDLPGQPANPSPRF